MLQGLLDPKMDFVFKQIFGSEKHPDILISFLNATLKPIFPIHHVKIQNTDLEKEYNKDKFSRLDILATTSNDELINVEIQLKNEYNMIKRSLYYWEKLYQKQLGEDDDYSELKRTVCINILNFKHLDTPHFHTCYRLKEIETNEELTDVCEIHFIEIPKLQHDSDEKDMLVAWTQFLKNPQSEKVRELEYLIPEIHHAKDTLIHLSADDEQRRHYEIRLKMLKDETSALNKATRDGIAQCRVEGHAEGRAEGIAEGILTTKLKLAKELIGLLDDDLIAFKTGLSLQEVKELHANVTKI